MRRFDFVPPLPLGPLLYFLRIIRCLQRPTALRSAFQAHPHWSVVYPPFPPEGKGAPDYLLIFYLILHSPVFTLPPLHPFHSCWFPFFQSIPSVPLFYPSVYLLHHLPYLIHVARGGAAIARPDFFPAVLFPSFYSPRAPLFSVLPYFFGGPLSGCPVLSCYPLSLPLRPLLRQSCCSPRAPLPSRSPTSLAPVDQSSGRPVLFAVATSKS